MKKRKRILPIILGLVALICCHHLIEEHIAESNNKTPPISNESPTISVENTEQSGISHVPEEYTVPAPDAEAYYQENSQIITVVDAQTSAAVLTEAEAYTTLTGLGFTQFPITSSYSMNSAYYDAEEITGEGSAKHPIYETYYLTANREIWTIFMINGAIMANPVSYNLQSTLGTQVMLSASESVMSYDSTTNKFFETIPKDEALFLLIAQRIDASLLEMLTVEDIDNYVY